MNGPATPTFNQQALINAIRASAQAAGGNLAQETPQSIGKSVGGFAQALADAHKKANPTLYDQNGLFDWQKAMAPNQGWSTIARSAAPGGVL